MCDKCMARWRHILISMAVLALAAGCTHSRQRAMLETIPAASSVIVHVDADRLLKMAGCHSQNGSITLTSDMESLLGRHAQALSMLSECARLGAIIDLTDAYAFNYDSCWMVTAPIKSQSTTLHQGMPCMIKDVGRAYASTNGGVSLLVTDTQAWLGYCHGDTLAQRLASVIAAADKASVNQYATVADFLPTPEHLATAYATMPLVHNPLGQDFNAVLAAIDGSDRRLTATMRMLRNGFPVDVADSLQTLDADALCYMPDGTMTSFAIGLDRGTIMRLMQWSRSFPLASQLAVNAITALADPDGGTMALGIAPGGSAETIKHMSLDNWLFRAVLPIADKGEDMAAIINRVITDKLYSESDSVYLSITNYDMELYPSDYQIECLPNAQMQARVAIDYRSQVMKAFGLSTGYMIEAWVADSALHAMVKAQGPTKYLLPGFIRDLSHVIR